MRGDTFNRVEARPRSSQYTKDMTVAAGTELRMNTVARSRLDLDTRVFSFVRLNDVRAARPFIDHFSSIELNFNRLLELSIEILT